MTKQPPPHGGADPRADPLVRRVLGEKRRILTLIRALDRAGMDPQEIVPLRVPLVRLAEVDDLLTSILELLERTAGGEDAGELELDPLLQIVEQARGDVFDALASSAQRSVRRALDEVVASEAEIWLEVEAFRREAGAPKVRSVRPRRGPMTQAEAERAATAAWSGVERPPRDRSQVRRHERTPLPADDAPLAAWLAWLPAPWIQAMAALHEVDAHAPRAEVEGLLGRRLADDGWLRTYLAERLGASERELLSFALAHAPVPMQALGPSRRGAFDVPWDWEAGAIATSGGRLRASGLVQVGAHEGRRTLCVPGPLRARLAEALARIDPAAAGFADRELRASLAAASTRLPFDDADLGRWKALGKDLDRLLPRWAKGMPEMGAAFDVLFQGLERELSSDAETAAVFEYAMIDWRGAGATRSYAQQRLAAAPLKEPGRQQLAEAALAAQPALYEVVALTRARSVELEPLFPPGPRVTVEDRAFSLVAEVGVQTLARVYPAGPFKFLRLGSDAILAAHGQRMLRELRRGQAAFAQEGGADDPQAYVSAQPWALLRAYFRCKGS